MTKAESRASRADLFAALMPLVQPPSIHHLTDTSAWNRSTIYMPSDSRLISRTRPSLDRRQDAAPPVVRRARRAARHFESAVRVFAPLQ